MKRDVVITGFECKQNALARVLQNFLSCSLFCFFGGYDVSPWTMITRTITNKSSSFHSLRFECNIFDFVLLAIPFRPIVSIIAFGDVPCEHFVSNVEIGTSVWKRSKPFQMRLSIGKPVTHANRESDWFKQSFTHIFAAWCVCARTYNLDFNLTK